MVTASDVKEGIVIRWEDRLARVTKVAHHTGSGQMSGFVALTLKDLRSGHISEVRLKPTDKVDTVNLENRSMEFLYRDAEAFYFMDPESYEQYSIPWTLIGNIERFLKEGMPVTVELFEGEALSLQFPKTVTLTVTMTGPGIKDTQSSTMKPATLENGMEILVPQFIVTGDLVRVDVESGSYIERVTPHKA